MSNLTYDTLDWDVWICACDVQIPGQAPRTTIPTGQQGAFSLPHHRAPPLLFSSSAPIFLSLKSKILCFLWSLFSTQSSTMSMILNSLVSQTHPVFLGYNLAVWEFGWSYGGEANLSLKALKGRLDTHLAGIASVWLILYWGCVEMGQGKHIEVSMPAAS